MYRRHPIFSTTRCPDCQLPGSDWSLDQRDQPSPKRGASDAFTCSEINPGICVPKALGTRVSSQGEHVNKQWQLVALLAGIILVLSPTCRNSCQQFAKLLVRFGIS
jgi:hypothetical protein